MSQQGIDLGRSGWANPEGFQPQRKPAIPAPPVPEVCGDQGPEGWVCDLKPGHKPAEDHWADTGEAGGLRWSRSVHDVSTFDDLSLPDGERPKIQGGIVESHKAANEFRTYEDALIDALNSISALASEGLKNPAPAAWAIALSQILEVSKNV